MSRAWVCLDLREDHPAARFRDRPGADAGRDDVRCAGAALHEIVGQVHHFAEPMIHHRELPVDAEHAQTVRHVVQRSVELASQRRLALARHKRLHEYSVQIGRDLHERQKKYGAEEPTSRRNRPYHATPAQSRPGRSDECDLQMEISTAAHRPSPTSPATTPVVTDKQIMWTTASSAAQQGSRAPGADSGGLDHRPDLIALLPLRIFIGSQGCLARLDSAAAPNARTAPATMRSATHAQIRVSPVFSAVRAAAAAGKTMLAEQRSGSFEQRINQAPRERSAMMSCSSYSRWLGKLHFRVRVLCDGTLYPA